MKRILINDFGTKDSGTEIDAAVVTFETESGDRFNFTFSDQSSGITVRMTRKQGWDQMAIHPRMANQIDVV